MLHGTQGFRVRHVQLAEDVAKGGFITVAGCWFRGNYAIDLATRRTTPRTHPDGIDCPNLPELDPTPAGVAPSFRNAGALVRAARTLPGVRDDRVGLLGHSRGSKAALAVAGADADVGAVVAIAGYLPARTLELRPPVLVLQGTADRIVPVRKARQFQKALRAQGKLVEAYYYEGAGHQIPFAPPWSADVRQRAIAFFTERLLK